MYALPKYRPLVSLISGGGPQFLDFQHDAETLCKFSRSFQQTTTTDATGKIHKLLRGIITQDNGTQCDEITGKAITGGIEEVSAKKCLDPWLDNWLPVPFLRVRDQKWEDETPKFSHGPANWARARITRTTPETTSPYATALRIVLVFDMTVEEPPKGSPLYFALAHEDVEAHATFSLATRLRDNGWFLNEAWVDQWLRGLWEKHKNRKKSRQEDAFEHECFASYLTMLDVLHKAIEGITVQSIKPADTPVDVDLVLDIGNSRTTGILVETRTQRSTNLNDSYLLQLRDLDAPERIYTDPFETRVEFSEAQFGDENLSRQSGRRTPAFVWPSPVRIGPEAARLSTEALCAEGITGMSSPKRYLWDERDFLTGWRYNTKGGQEPRVTRGPLPRLVNSSGSPLCCLSEGTYLPRHYKKTQEMEMAFASNFTRSSVMLFLLVEVLQQALITINSPGQRTRRELPNVPRRLRQVIFTVPPGMPIAEQRIYRRWVRCAVRLLWEILGWQEYYIADHQKAPSGKDFRLSPRVKSHWDEATCTQLVYIYNEVINKFQGDAHTLCNIIGRPREQYGNKPAIRLATIDIGGGTTDLSITTFTQENAVGATTRMSAHIELRDGFTLAGDDIIRDVIKDLVLPAVRHAFAEAGIAHADALTATLFGRDVMDSSQESRNRRAQCVRQVLMPVALGLLSAYERSLPRSGEGAMTFTLRDFFVHPRDAGNELPILLTSQPLPNPTVLAYIEDAARRASGLDFSLLDVPLRMNPQKIDMVIQETLGNVLAHLCEVIQKYDCDMLLLTGRPSQWRAMVSAIYAKLPVPPDRILPMGNYRVDTWYPFADTNGNITDPKTTVVVGAILCSLAEGHLQGFSLDPRALTPTSTARFIGEMDTNGRITAPKVWFTVDIAAQKEQIYTKSVQFAGPIALGFRQLDVERWPTTRFYVLDFTSEDARRSAADKLPYTLTISLTLHECEDEDSETRSPDNQRDEGEFMLEEAQDRFGNPVNTKDLQMRLQTLPLDEGVWLDTGIVL